jgi:hypothetical protein
MHCEHLFGLWTSLIDILQSTYIFPMKIRNKKLAGMFPPTSGISVLGSKLKLVLMGVWLKVEEHQPGKNSEFKTQYHQNRFSWLSWLYVTTR